MLSPRSLRHPHIALIAAAALLVGAPVATAQERPPSPVAVSKVVERELRSGRTFVGSVIPVRTARVGSEVEALVTATPVKDGDRVEAGQELVRLRSTTMEIQMDGALAELAEREQELKELENGARPQEIAQAQARVDASEADLTYRRFQRESAKTLFDAKHGSEDDYRLKLAAEDRATATLAADRAALALLEEGPRKERIAGARARVDVQKALVKRMKDDIERHIVRAPFAGCVAARHVEVGEWIARGMAVAEVVEIDEVHVEVPVLEDAIAHVAIGAEVRLEVSALRALEGGGIFVGVVDEIVPAADTLSRTFPVRIRLKNKPGPQGRGLLLHPGMLARATLSVGNASKGKSVPKDALVLGGPQPVVYVIVPGDGPEAPATVAPTPVELGIADGGFIQIAANIPLGAQVVVRGNERLFPGMKVMVLPEDKVPAADASKPAGDEPAKEQR